MKTPLIATLAFSLFLPAYAEEPPIIGNPDTEMVAMLQCTATGLVMAHAHGTVAASITALSAAEIDPQLALIVTSYKTLAEADQTRVAAYLDVISQKIVPEIVSNSMMDANVIQSHIKTLLNKMLIQSTLISGNPTQSVTDQIAVQHDLLAQLDKCDSLTAAISGTAAQKGIDQ